MSRITKDNDLGTSDRIPSPTPTLKASSKFRHQCCVARISTMLLSASAFRALFALALGLFVTGVPLLAEDTVAISAKVSNGYARRRLPDGSFKVERYAFGKGDDMSSVRVDASADKLDFMT